MVTPPTHGRRMCHVTPTHWRRVALIAAKRTGKRIGLDTATRMAQDAALRGRVHSSPLSSLNELKRILSGK